MSQFNNDHHKVENKTVYSEADNINNPFGQLLNMNLSESQDSICDDEIEVQEQNQEEETSYEYDSESDNTNLNEDYTEEPEEELGYDEADLDELDRKIENSLDMIEKKSMLNFESFNIRDILDMDEDFFKDEEEVIDVQRRKEPEYILIDKHPSELSSFDKMLLKQHPERYRVGQVAHKRKLSKKAKKKQKKLERINNMSEEEKAEYYEKQRKKEEQKEYNKFNKEIIKYNDPKKVKKRKKMEQKIYKAYKKQVRENNKKFNSYKKILRYKDMEKFKKAIHYNFVMGKKERHDPYARYRKHGNIITVSEAEQFAGDFKTSFLKNLEIEIMNKLNEPITVGGKTVVEYYDKKGKLKSREILNDKRSKKDRKKQKKHEKKLKKKVMSPDYYKLY